MQQNFKRGISLQDALCDGYRAILRSPRFLHFHETPGQLDDHALACRLSYFIWNSMPDSRLTALADTGELGKSEVLRQQRNRMLNDERGGNFVQKCAAGWLDLSRIDLTEPDRKLYPGFDVIAQQSILDETHAFLATMIRNNVSVTQLISADHTFLNNGLPRFCDISRIHGDTLRPVRRTVEGDC